MTGKQKNERDVLEFFSLMLYRHESKAIGATKLSDLGEQWRFYDVIGIDEGQFFEDVRIHVCMFISDE
jgi:thymidine kinase